jgi:hypothetical protein
MGTSLIMGLREFLFEMEGTSLGFIFSSIFSSHFSRFDTSFCCCFSNGFPCKFVIEDPFDIQKNIAAGVFRIFQIKEAFSTAHAQLTYIFFYFICLYSLRAVRGSRTGSVLASLMASPPQNIVEELKDISGTLAKK